MRPTGTARFCDCNAPTTCATVMPAASIAAGLISTVSSRSMPPTTVASATPGMPRSKRVTPGSAMRVSEAAGSVDELSDNCTIGWSAGSKRVSTGSFISNGRSERMELILSRMSCDACCRSFSKRKKTVTLAKPSCAAPEMRSTPEMPLTASSTRSSTSRSTTSGEAPGYGIATLMIGCCTSGNSSVSSCQSEKRPKTTSATIETMVISGRLMAKSEMNMRTDGGRRMADGGAPVLPYCLGLVSLGVVTLSGVLGLMPRAGPTNSVSPAVMPAVTS